LNCLGLEAQDHDSKGKTKTKTETLRVNFKTETKTKTVKILPRGFPSLSAVLGCLQDKQKMSGKCSFLYGLNHVANFPNIMHIVRHSITISGIRSYGSVWLSGKYGALHSQQKQEYTRAAPALIVIDIRSQMSLSTQFT